MQKSCNKMLTSDHTKRRSSRLAYRKHTRSRETPFTALLGALAKLRKATISFGMSVRPSMWPHGTIPLPLDRFSWNLYSMIFWKSVKFQNWWKSDINSGYFTWTHTYIYENIRWILLRIKNVSHKNCRQNQNTRFIFIFFFRNRAF